MKREKEMEEAKTEMKNLQYMNDAQAMDYVEELKQYGSVPGLTNIRNLCEKLGNPQEELSFVHIAGTNGKGSVLAFVSEILKAAGYRTGRYFSPAVFEYREQIQISGRPISKRAFCRWMTVLKACCEQLAAEGKPHPTAFEVETALAFAYFRERKCQIVVLECGLGGLLDATNIVQNTLAAVFTSISYDHMAVLGKTLREIAVQKAGILKPGAAVAALKGPEEVMEVLREKTAAMELFLTVADPAKAGKLHSALEGQTFSYAGYDRLEIALAGRYEVDNAVLALETVWALQDKGFPIGEDAIRRGLAGTAWPGRFQILLRKPVFIADGAHNRDAAVRLAETIRFYFTNRRILYIIGMLRDKEQEEVLRATCPLAEQIFTVPTKGERGMDAYEMAVYVKPFHPAVTALDSVQEAVELSLLLADKDTVIVAFGSLSYLGELIRNVELLADRKERERIGKDDFGAYTERGTHGKQRKA